MKNLHTTRTVAIIAALFFIGAVCVYAYALYHTSSMGGMLRERLQTIANSNEKIRSSQDLQGLYETSKEDRERLRSFALTQDEAGDFLTEIERMGTQVGVAITTNGLKVEKKKDTPDQLVIQFTLEGTEQAVRTMVQMLEVLPYPSYLSGLTLSEGETQYRGTVDIVVLLSEYDR
jgi:hypothetical protein